MATDRRVLKILRPFCKRIRFNGKHYVCYPKNSDKVIVVSATPSDHRYWGKVKTNFRSAGIDLGKVKI